MPHRLNLSRLPHLPPPVLTAYLDVNPGNPRNQGTPRGYVTWLTSAGQALVAQLTGRDRKLFRKELARVEHFLRTARPRAQSLAVFAGPKVWETIRLQVDVVEELHWGKPSLQQMLWVLDEHRPRGIVVADGSKARFFCLWLGKITEDKSAAFTGDFAPGRKKGLVGTSHPRMFSKAGGVDRDFSGSRMAVQRGRFARTLVPHLMQWSEERRLSPIAVVGVGDMVDRVLDAMPDGFRARIVPIRKTLPRVSLSDLRRTLEPELKMWERDYETSLVRELAAGRGSNAVALGLDETLAALQDGRVRELVVARGLTGSLRQCVRCGRADRSAGRVCAICGAERRPRTLRTLLPELASIKAVPAEIVAGEAAKELRAAGGIGALLRSGRSSPRRTGGARRPSSTRRGAGV
jgi:release factor family 10